MAHPSEEHHTATASMATPTSARTSGRSRDIFKPRRSTSAGSPMTLKKPPPAVAETENVSQSDCESLHAPKEKSARKVESASAGCSHVPVTEPVAVHQLSTKFKLGAEAEVESIGALSSSTPRQSKSLIALTNIEDLQTDVSDDLLSTFDAHSHQKLFASNIFDVRTP